MWSNPFFMAGSEGSGQYVVVAVSPVGRIGYRVLGEQVRVRMEPASPELAREVEDFFVGWTQPGEGKPRFSIVASKGSEAVKAVGLGLVAVGNCSAPTQFNPAARKWREDVGRDASSGDEPDEEWPDLFSCGDESHEDGEVSPPPKPARPPVSPEAVAREAEKLAEALRALRAR